MTHRSVRLHHLAPFVVAILFGACRDGLGPADVAGVYALRSSSGGSGRETAVSGTLTLTPWGGAERRLSYRFDTTSVLTELVSAGTFRVTDSTVALALRENAGGSPYVWRLTATIEDNGVLRLEYPRPADGTIVEIYQR